MIVCKCVSVFVCVSISVGVYDCMVRLGKCVCACECLVVFVCVSVYVFVCVFV